MTNNSDLKQKFGKVAVLFGGDSAEREVSLNSGNAVLKALKEAGCDAYAFDPAEQPLANLVTQGFDRAFVVLHGRGGEDGTIQGALSFLKIPYTGSEVLGSALGMDKVRCKQIFQACGLPTAQYHALYQNTYQEADLEDLLASLGGEVMVKPALEGSSIGMNKVTNNSDLISALEHAFQYDHKVLVERYITGKEFTVSILKGKALPSISMSTPRTFYDYEAKYQVDTTEYHCPSGLPDETETQLADIAVKAFSAVGASGWGRVDFMQDQEGQFYLLEVNTVPGMTEKSLVPMAAKQSGLDFEALCVAVLETSLSEGV